MNPKSTRKLLTGLAMLLFACSLCPQWSTLRTSVNPETKKVEERFTLGLPPSPWIVYSNVRSTQTIKNGDVSSELTSFSFTWSIQFISLSMLLLVAGGACLYVSKRIGRRASEAEVKPTAIGLQTRENIP